LRRGRRRARWLRTTPAVGRLVGGYPRISLGSVATCRSHRRRRAHHLMDRTRHAQYDLCPDRRTQEYRMTIDDRTTAGDQPAGIDNAAMDALVGVRKIFTRKAAISQDN